MDMIERNANNPCYLLLYSKNKFAIAWPWFLKHIYCIFHDLNIQAQYRYTKITSLQ